MLDVRLLGEQRVAASGRVIDVGRSTRMLGVLGYLIVHAGSPQLRRHVAGLFWPDSTDGQARTNLRRELHQMRSALPDAERCLAFDDNTIAWRADAPCAVDVIEFQSAASVADQAAAAADGDAFVDAARRAVRAYGGDLLPGFYDDWVLAERDRLRRSCVTLIDQLVPLVADRGDLDTAIEHARRRTELEPLEESGYRTLMNVQARSGDRAAALRTFHACSSVLERELGVEPSDATLEIYDGLLARPPEPTGGAPSLRYATRLIGRDVELAQLHADWKRAADGPPRMVVIAGEAGVGKTRVLTEFADAVESADVLVARARCFGSRTSLALAPVAEWLRTVAPRRAAGYLDPGALSAVARLVPELAPDDGPRTTMPLTEAWQRGQFLDGLARAVLAAGGPTLLLLDDLQWCDAQTLGWIELLLHLEQEVPLLIAATLRTEEAERSTTLTTFRTRLRAAGMMHEVGLAPLGVAEVTELAATIGGDSFDDAAARRLHKQTGGFPLFVIESLRGGATGSERIDAILTGRLAQLEPPADELVGLAAAVGRDFSLELLAAAADLAVDVVVDAVDQMWRQRLLREYSPTTYDFSHDLLRDAAYRQLASPHRRIVHRRIAAAIEQLHAGDLDAIAGQIADQHERGGQPDRALRFHMLAAEAASAVFAHDDAVDHYARALRMLATLPAGPVRDRRELELCDGMLPPALALAGYSAPQVGETLARMIELAERLGDDEAMVRSQASLAANLFVQGRIHDLDELTAGLSARAADHPEHVGQISLTRTYALTSLGHHDQALAELHRIEQHGDVTELILLGFPVQVMAAGWKAHVLWLTGQSSHAAASAAVAIGLAEDFDHPWSRAIAEGYRAVTCRLLGDIEATGEQAAAVRRLCDRYGFAYYGEWGRILEGWAIGGAAGESLIRAGLARLRADNAGARTPFWLALLSEVLFRGGRAREALRVLDEARTWAEEHGDVWWLAELCRLAAATRIDEEAEPLLERALAVAGGQGAVALELRAATDLAGRWLDAGRPEAVGDLLRPIRRRADGCNRADLAAADALLAETAV